MAKGFFKPSEVQIKTKQVGENAQCGKCKLFSTCNSPKMLPTGSGDVPLLNIIEAPGRKEDLTGDQFVGEAGLFHRGALFQFDIDIEECLMDQAVRCRPLKSKAPTANQIKCCAPNLQKSVKESKPRVIIALGGPPLASLITHKFQRGVGGITKWQGCAIPDREYNAWICPTFHPGYLTRDTTPEIAERFYMDDLERAVSLLDVPLPKYDKEEDLIQFIKHPGQAVKYLKHLIQDKVRLTAFDYETTGLKPHRKEMRIKTCAISEGPFHSVAFPFFDDLKFQQAFKAYLLCKFIKKICANIKYERDWSIAKLFLKIQGLFFDTMIGAHFINNRPGITSLEHNNYVNFGIEPYDTHLKKYLKSGKSGNDLNNIDDISLEDILMYNGMDSLTEFRNALIQMDIIGWPYEHLWDGITGLELCPQYKGLIHASKNKKNKGRKRKEKEAPKRKRIRREET